MIAQAVVSFDDAFQVFELLGGFDFLFEHLLIHLVQSGQCILMRFGKPFALGVHAVDVLNVQPLAIDAVL